MKNKFYIIFFITSCLHANTSEYEINLYGLNVAKCKVQIKDTTMYNKESIKIEYIVKSINLMKWIFNVDNYYTTIIDKNNHNILHYSKRSIQPKVNNQISTIYNSGNVSYIGTDLYINNNDYNIFSLLYAVSLGVKDFKKKSIIIDREGKKYLGKINLTDINTYDLELTEININNDGVEKKTDIFSWALFLPETNKTIKVDPEKKIISVCSFNKRFIKFTAKFKE